MYVIFISVNVERYPAKKEGDFTDRKIQRSLAWKIKPIIQGQIVNRSYLTNKERDKLKNWHIDLSPERIYFSLS